MPRDRLGAVLTTVWGLGHIAAGLLLVETGRGSAVAVDHHATVPDVPVSDAHDDGARTCRCGPRPAL
ncbi:hypothetical protein ACWGHA_03245 [Streptomyces xanthophaeus]